MPDGWQGRALHEISGIRPHWIRKYGWKPRVQEDASQIDLYVQFAQLSGRRYLLRLRYQVDFETAGRREAFVNPDDPQQEGPKFWPQGGAFKAGDTPPKICLEGTYGFHSGLHRDRDGRVANVNKLLMEIQKCLNT